MRVALSLFNGGVNTDINVGTTKLNFWGYSVTKACSGILILITFHGKLLNMLGLFTKFVPISP